MEQHTVDFVYEPLRDAESAIRILEISPDLLNGQIQITLRHGCMPARYRCVSYMWGNDTQDQEILVNNQCLRVRKNLYDFLDMARDRIPGRTLWIDAVCINQNDIIEKNYQVQRMGKIFQGATEVLVWLGTQPQLDCIFDFVSNLVQTDASSIDRDSLLHRSDSRSESIDSGIKSLCSNPYWSRAWIAQEILLAQHVRIMNGSRQAEWRSMIRAVKVVRKVYPMEPEFMSSPMLKFWDEWPWAVSQYQSDRSIWNLGWVWDSHCTDPRDRIYSLLALITDSGFRVDYAEDICSLFWRAGEHFKAWNSLESLKSLSQALNLDAAALEQDTRKNLPRFISLAVAYMRAPNQDDTSESLCEECGSSQDSVTGKEVSLCIQDPTNIRESQHAILRPAADGSFTVTLLPSYRTSIRGPPRTFGPDALRRIVDGHLTEVASLPTWEDYIYSPNYRIVLPAEVVIQNLKILEAPIKAPRKPQSSDGVLAKLGRLIGLARTR